jgi:hypothetical protein
VLSTQGRSFWILDNLTPLHQLPDAGAQAYLFQPREAVRTPGHSSGEGGGSKGGSGDPEYPAAGAMIDYYLASAAPADITLDIIDSLGKKVRTFSSVKPAPEHRREGEAATGEEDESMPRSGPVVLDKTAGMHRFIWDLRYPGPWQSEQRPEGPNGPKVVPGKYTAKLTAGSFTATQRFLVTEDPRVTRAGITTADLQEQFNLNLQVREMVSEVNHAVARVKSAQAKLKDATGAEADRLARLNDFASHLITPSIRYSKPELATQIAYLYTLTNGADQKIGHDAVVRYAVLRKELDERMTQLKAILGS